MKRYEKILIHYSEDITKIREFIPEIAHLSDFYIQFFYEEFSELYYCAGWLVVNEDSLSHFKEWILKDI